MLVNENRLSLADPKRASIFWSRPKSTSSVPAPTLLRVTFHPRRVSNSVVRRPAGAAHPFPVRCRSPGSRRISKGAHIRAESADRAATLAPEKAGEEARRAGRRQVGKDQAFQSASFTSTGNSRSSSSTGGCWRRSKMRTCRCWSGCASCASSATTWTNFSRSGWRASRRRSNSAPTHRTRRRDPFAGFQGSVFAHS